MKSERGMTLVELIVTIPVALLILSATLAMVEVAMRDQARVAARVVENQRGRPVMNNIMADLHSTCVAPGAAPILPGSNDNTLSFFSQSGSAVSPIPDKHVITFSNGTLTESVYPATGSAAPAWDNSDFSTTPSSTRQLLNGVSNATLGDPPTTVPIFQYFAYVGAEIPSTGLPTTPNGLSTADAAKTVKVFVSFRAAPESTPAPDTGPPISLSNSAVIRLEPASEDTGQVNLPCV
jgi:hypothetical protein